MQNRFMHKAIATASIVFSIMIGQLKKLKLRHNTCKLFLQQHNTKLTPLRIRLAHACMVLPYGKAMARPSARANFTCDH